MADRKSQDARWVCGEPGSQGSCVSFATCMWAPHAEGRAAETPGGVRAPKAEARAQEERTGGRGAAPAQGHPRVGRSCQLELSRLWPSRALGLPRPWSPDLGRVRLLRRAEGAAGSTAGSPSCSLLPCSAAGGGAGGERATSSWPPTGFHWGPRSLCSPHAELACSVRHTRLELSLGKGEICSI